MTESGVAELVKAVREGDQDAFARLYRDNVGAVHLAVRDNLREPDRVADAVQETFARALASLEKLRDPEKFRPWLLSIARHTAVDLRRSANRYGTDELEDDAVVTTDADDPAELAALRDVAGMVRGLVAGLSRRDAVALNLVTLGFDVADVAAALRVKHGAAKVVLHRARRRLRSALVLQLLAGGAATTCAELTPILEKNGVTAAGKHAETCPECERSARKAVYG